MDLSVTSDRVINVGWSKEIMYSSVFMLRTVAHEFLGCPGFSRIVLLKHSEGVAALHRRWWDEPDQTTWSILVSDKKHWK